MNRFEQYNPTGDEALEFSAKYGVESDDVIVYNVQKFFKLCADANPNIIELLFSNPIYKTETWDEIIKHRDLFLSQKIIHTFAGYAYSQLKRIEKHYKWLKHPPQKPDPFIFGMVYDKTGAAKWLFPDLQKKYKKLLRVYQQYKIWIKNRNPYRAKL